MKIIPPEILLRGYRQGIFPMAGSRFSKEVEWYTAPQRGVIPIGKFHVSKNLQRVIRQGKFKVKINTRFREVLKGCADRPTTWINDLIINSYDILHQMGHAHSVEIYKNGALAGGLYGVHIGAAFFGESMFHYEADADKIALYYGHQILQKNGFLLWDAQFYTEHLGRFGCIEIDGHDYEKRLHKALKKERDFKFPSAE